MKRADGMPWVSFGWSSARGGEVKGRWRCDGAKERIIRLWCAVLFCVSSVAHAEMLTVEWDPNADHENTTGYIVSYGNVSKTAKGFRGYEVNVDVGLATLHTIEFLPPGPVYVAIRAYNDLGVVSDFSEEIVLGETSPTQSVSDSMGSTRMIDPFDGGRQKQMNGASLANRSNSEKLSQIAELERKRDALLQTLTPKHPDVRALQRKLDRLRREVGFSP